MIYAIPYTSIIEQNANVFRDAVGTDAVLEHHSAFDSDSEDQWARLATENWDAPLIVTTNVQFFESFFASRSSACRKLHNVARSVIILDEVQTLPVGLLQACLGLLQELASSYGCTIVLCTATQPAIEWREEFPIGIKGVTPIISNPASVFDALQRVAFQQRGRLADENLAREVALHNQVLCIVNTRRHAHDLYHLVGRADGNFHLSALMCPAHRACVLSRIRDRLKAGEDCRVVSTQLIEAGVDVDFPVVYRAMAGLDSVAQAAGRCNREGLVARGLTVVFEPETAIPAGHLRQSAQAAMEILPDVTDLLSPQSIEKYFRLFYWQRKDEWDRLQVVRRLGAGYASLDFPFRSIAEDFQFIRDGMSPVIIAFDDAARREIDTLRYAPVPPGGIDRRLQRYVVTVPRHVRDTLPVEVFHERFYVLADPGLYDEHTGLCAGQASPVWDIERLMV